MLNSQEELLTLTPTPHFVVKTRLVGDANETQQHTPGAKYFINVCTDDQVPLPIEQYNPPRTYQLIMENAWEIPIVTSDERRDTDKKGQQAYVHDCVINTRAMGWVQQDNELREILLEWCLESVELRSDVVLSREDIATPKMISKGRPLPIKLLKSDMDNSDKNHSATSGTVENPEDLIQMRRLVEDDEDNDVEINMGSTISSEKVSTRPLIQEITNMSIKDKPKPSQSTKKLNQSAQTSDKEVLKFQTTMSKVDQNGFKLRIEITSQIESSLDYNLDLDRSTSTLILKNLNPYFTTKRDLELPLPTTFVNPVVESYFVAKEKKLVIFVK